MALLFCTLVFPSCSSKSSHSPNQSDGYHRTPSRNDGISTDEKGEDITNENTIGDIGTRKLIKEANISIETKEYDEFISNLEKEIKIFGGYIQKSEISGSGDYRNRYAEIVVRIPADRLDGFTNQVSALGNILSKTENVQDVTMDYVDIESRIKALKTQQESLLELMKKSGSLSDILAIQKELTEVQYQLESYESKLRTYDNLIAYGTVTMHIYEVQRETPTSNLSMWEEIGINLSENLNQIGSTARSMFIWFVSSSPYILILVIVALIIFLIIRFSMKASAKKGRSKINSPPDNHQK